MPINYHSAKIYKITGGGLTYYGATVQTLCRRFAKHRTNKKRVENGKQSTRITSFQILDYPDCDICLVENFPCNSRDELHQRERYYIENNKCVNKVIPGRTPEEYRQDNKEKIKQYYNDNKDKIKQYSNDNKDKIKQYQSDYRKRNLPTVKYEFNLIIAKGIKKV